MGEAWSWGNVRRHFASYLQLPVGAFREQHDQEILERDHPNLHCTSSELDSDGILDGSTSRE